MTRTIQITIQFDIEQTVIDNHFVENPADLGQLASGWWENNHAISDFNGVASCSACELIAIEEPKARRYSAAFQRSLEKKRAKVKVLCEGAGA